MTLSKSVIFSFWKRVLKTMLWSLILKIWLEVENLIESGVDNWVESGVDNYEQEIDCENLVCVAHDCSHSIKNWDDSSSRIVSFRV